MALAQQDFYDIEEYVKHKLVEWLPSDWRVHDRITRVEEELKHQSELTRQGFEQMEKRFQYMQDYLDKRFEQVDKRFEQVDNRFEQVDRRFERTYTFMRWQAAIAMMIFFGIMMKLFFA